MRERSMPLMPTWVYSRDAFQNDLMGLNRGADRNESCELSTSTRNSGRDSKPLNPIAVDRSGLRFGDLKYRRASVSANWRSFGWVPGVRFSRALA